MNTEQVLQDFRRRYEGTFVHVEIQKEQKEVLARVREITNNQSKIGTLILETLDYGALQLNMGSEGHALKFKYPPVGVFQNGKIACVFYRIPSRQYARGLCVHNSRIQNVGRLLGASNPSYNFVTLENAFQHKQFSVNEALPQLKKDCRSVALADNLSIMLSPIVESENYLILHYTQPIAACSPGGHIRKVYEKVYKELLRKHF